MTHDSIDFDARFAGRPCLVMRPDFRIVWVSDVYRRTSLLWDQRIIGQYMFEAFPDNPRVPDLGGVRSLQASLTRVLRSGGPDHMRTLRYDIRDYVGGGGTRWLERYWTAVNEPVWAPGSSEVKYLLHEATDVSAAVRLARRLKDEEAVAAEQVDRLRRMIQERVHLRRRLMEGRRQIERLMREASGVGGDELMRYVDDLSGEVGWNLPPGDYLGPGEIVPVTGDYESFHLQGCHTLNPQRHLRAGEPVPACPWCGEGVLFRVPTNPHRIH